MKHIKEYDEFINEAADIKVGDIVFHHDRHKRVVNIIGNDIELETLRSVSFNIPGERQGKTYFYETGITNSASMDWFEFEDSRGKLNKKSSDVLFPSKKEAMNAMKAAIQQAKDRIKAEKEEAKILKRREDQKEWRENNYTTKQYERILKGVMEDMIGDNPDAAFDSGYTADLARNLMMDKKIQKYIERTYDVYREDDIKQRLQWDLESFA